MGDERRPYGRDGAGDRPGAGGRGRRAGGPAGLPQELRSLGRALDERAAWDGPETMVERVLGQILAEQVPVPVAGPAGAAGRLRAVRRWARTRWRALTAALCGLLTVLVLTPPVRAAVFDWFGFAGAEVRYDPSAAPSPGARVPGCGRPVSLAEAGRRAGFEPLVPRELGAPDAVSVTAEPAGRFLVSLCWGEDGRTIRLDERRASLDLGFTKTVRYMPEWIELAPGARDGSTPDPALWFARPHLLTFWLADEDGARYERSERTAGPTLLWAHRARGEEVTLRLEGVSSQTRASQIARSLGGPSEEPSLGSSQ